MKYGVNLQVVGKTEPQNLSHPGAWQTSQGTLGDLAAHIGRGHPWMPALLDGNRKRWQTNANHAEVLALDIDGGLTIAEAISHPFVAQYCGLGIETASSSPELHKFRLVFKLHQPATGWQTIRLLNRYLAEQVGAADPACKDASRFFFGAPGRQAFLLNETAQLPESFVSEAIAWHQGIEAEEARRAEQARRQWEAYQAANPEDSADDLIRSALAAIDPDCDYSTWIAIGMALAGMGDQWLQEWDAWSASSSSYKPRECSIKWRSFRGKRPAPEVIFGIAKRHGWRFPRRQRQQLPSARPLQRVEGANGAQLATLQQQAQAAAKRAWEKSRRYTPTAEISERYVSNVPSEELLRGDIAGLRSAMNSGKTEGLIKILAQTDRGAIAIGSRNSLLLQSCKRWGGFYHLHADSAFGLIADRQSRIACCIDSLLHFQDSDFDGKIVILDEVTSIVKHALLSSTLRDRRAPVLAKFEQAMIRAAQVIPWDGNNSDLAIDYLAQLRGPGCTVTKLLNTAPGDSINFELVRSLSADGKLLVSSQGAVIEKLGEALRAYRHVEHGPKAIAAVSDSQRLLEATDTLYSEQGYKVLRLDAKTLATPEGRALALNFTAYLEQERPDLVLLSPIAESGFDIPIRDYFAQGFAFFFGLIDTATQTQLLRRVRYCYNWSVSCPEYTRGDDWEGQRSPFARSLNKQMLEYLQADALAALDGSDRQELAAKFAQLLQAQSESPHHQTAVQLLAARNYERQHTRECLQQALEEAGHSVQLVDLEAPGATTDTEGINRAKAEIIEADSRAILAARDIGIKEACEIRARFQASLDDRRAAEKAFLKARLPGIENTAAWSWEFIAKALYTERGMIKRLERWWLLKNMGAARTRARQLWTEAIEGNAMLSDVRTDFRQLQALDRLGLADLCNGQGHDSNSEQVRQIWERCKRSKSLQNALGRSPGKLSPTNWAGCLARMVGIASKGTVKPRAERGGSGGDRTYVYQSPADDPMGAIVLNCIARRFEKYLSEPEGETSINQGLEADHLTSKKNTPMVLGDPPLVPAPSGLQPGAAVRWAAAGLTGRLVALTGTTASFEPAGGGLFYLPLADLQAG